MPRRFLQDDVICAGAEDVTEVDEEECVMAVALCRPVALEIDG